MPAYDLRVLQEQHFNFKIGSINVFNCKKLLTSDQADSNKMRLKIDEQGMTKFFILINHDQSIDIRNSLLKRRYHYLLFCSIYTTICYVNFR